LKAEKIKKEQELTDALEREKQEKEKLTNEIAER